MATNILQKMVVQKLKRLKMFLKVEENTYVIMLLQGISEYGNKRKYLCKSNIEELERYIRKLKKLEKNLKFDKSILRVKKE